MVDMVHMLSNYALEEWPQALGLGGSESRIALCRPSFTLLDYSSFIAQSVPSRHNYLLEDT
jgi:hypothetical protein